MTGDIRTETGPCTGIPSIPGISENLSGDRITYFFKNHLQDTTGSCDPMKGTKRSKKPAKEKDPGVVKVPPGIKGLDEITGGGLPKGRPALVSGGPGNGKTLSAMEFIAGGITDHHEPGGFVSFEEKTEDLLREQRKQLQSILDNSRDIIFRVDRDFRFSVINEAGLRLIGLPAEQVLGKTNAELGALTELSELWETHYRNVFETSLADRFEQALPGPDGTRYYIATLVPESR